MIRALVHTLWFLFFIAACWVAVFYFVERNVMLFYILLALPIILVIFFLTFDILENDRRNQCFFNKMKRLEIRRELDGELWWWLPPETRMKWFNECSSIVEVYNKRMDVWRNH